MSGKVLGRGRFFNRFYFWWGVGVFGFWVCCFWSLVFLGVLCRVLGYDIEFMGCYWFVDMRGWYIVVDGRMVCCIINWVYLSWVGSGWC